jgi:hypothetical protein
VAAPENKLPSVKFVVAKSTNMESWFYFDYAFPPGNNKDHTQNFYQKKKKKEKEKKKERKFWNEKFTKAFKCLCISIIRIGIGEP